MGRQAAYLVQGYTLAKTANMVLLVRAQSSCTKTASINFRSRFTPLEAMQSKICIAIKCKKNTCAI